MELSLKEEITLIKGIHPGKMLARKLKERNLAEEKFAVSINEDPQTNEAVTNETRGMYSQLAMKVEKALNLDEGYFMTLQGFHEIEIERLKQERNNRPDLSKFKSVTFWDTDIQTIQWNKYRRAVIERVFQYGDSVENAEIIRFYGAEVVEHFIKRMIPRPIPHRIKQKLSTPE